MNISPIVYRRMLFIYTAIFIAVALTLMFGVIEAVEIEASIGATKPVAVTAFWVNIGLNLFIAAVLVIVAIRSRERILNAAPVHAIGGIVAVLLGIILADAASAYQSHGPQMQSASKLLYFCAAADFLAGVMLIITAFVQPKKM